MHTSFIEGFTKAAQESGLNKQQTFWLMRKYAASQIPGNGASQIPPLSAANSQGQMMPGAGMQPGMQQGAQIPPMNASIPQANQGQMEAPLTLAQVMRPKQPGPQVAAVQPRF